MRISVLVLAMALAMATADDFTLSTLTNWNIDTNWVRSDGSSGQPQAGEIVAFPSSFAAWNGGAGASTFIPGGTSPTAQKVQSQAKIIFPSTGRIILGNYLRLSFDTGSSVATPAPVTTTTPAPVATPAPVTTATPAPVATLAPTSPPTTPTRRRRAVGDTVTFNSMLFDNGNATIKCFKNWNTNTCNAIPCESDKIIFPAASSWAVYCPPDTFLSSAVFQSTGVTVTDKASWLAQAALHPGQFVSPENVQFSTSGCGGDLNNGIVGNPVLCPLYCVDACADSSCTTVTDNNDRDILDEIDNDRETDLADQQAPTAIGPFTLTFSMPLTGDLLKVNVHTKIVGDFTAASGAISNDVTFSGLTMTSPTTTVVFSAMVPKVRVSTMTLAYLQSYYQPIYTARYKAEAAAIYATNAAATLQLTTSTAYMTVPSTFLSSLSGSGMYQLAQQLASTNTATPTQFAFLTTSSSDSMGTLTIITTATPATVTTYINTNAATIGIDQDLDGTKDVFATPATAVTTAGSRAIVFSHAGIFAMLPFTSESARKMVISAIVDYISTNGAPAASTYTLVSLSKISGRRRANDINMILSSTDSSISSVTGAVMTGFSFGGETASNTAGAGTTPTSTDVDNAGNGDAGDAGQNNEQDGADDVDDTTDNTNNGGPGATATVFTWADLNAQTSTNALYPNAFIFTRSQAQLTVDAVNKDATSFATFKTQVAEKIVARATFPITTAAITITSTSLTFTAPSSNNDSPAAYALALSIVISATVTNDQVKSLVEQALFDQTLTAAEAGASNGGSGGSSSSGGGGGIAIIAAAIGAVLILIIIVAVIYFKKKSSKSSPAAANQADRTIVAFENPMYDDNSSGAGSMSGAPAYAGEEFPADDGGLYDEPSFAQSTKHNPVYQSNEDLSGFDGGAGGEGGYLDVAPDGGMAEDNGYLDQNELE